MNVKNHIIALVFFSFFNCYSQDSIIANSEYITKFSDKISTRLSLINTSNSFYVNDKQNNLKYKLEPNKQDYLGVSILFRSIELDFGFSPKFLPSNEDNENSKLFTLNFRMFHNQWMQTIDYYDQKGFYFINNDSEIDLPGVKTLKIGGSTGYIFNRNFSFRAIGFQNEWQTKSAGSFIPRIYYYYTKYTYKGQDFNEKAHSYDIALAPSYHYNFVFKDNFLFSLGGSAGIGLNHNTNLGNEDLTSVLYEASARAVLSYNSKTFIGGINYNIIVFDHHIDRISRQDDEISFLEFYIGYRFKAPKKLIDFADEFNKKHNF